MERLRTYLSVDRCDIWSEGLPETAPEESRRVRDMTSAGSLCPPLSARLESHGVDPTSLRPARGQAPKIALQADL